MQFEGDGLRHEIVHIKGQKIKNSDNNILKIMLDKNAKNIDTDGAEIEAVHTMIIHMMMNFVLLPMFFLSGAFFPLRGVPIWMEVLSKLDPVSYCVDPLRQVSLRALVPPDLMHTIALNPLAYNVIIMVSFAILFLIPAVWLFGRQK